jgi:ligand-binding sensor domain-containing protein
MTGDDTFWLGTRGSGLFQLKAGATNSITRGLPDSKINCLLPDRADNLWIGTDNGVARWDGAEVTTRNLPAELTKSQILTIIRDRDSNLWLGTDSRGVLRFNAEGVSSLDSAGGDARNAVMALFEDREGDLWIGSASQVERLRDSPFVTYSTPEGLPTDGGNPIFSDSENRTWFAPVSGGLWWMKNGLHGSIREAGLPNDIVYSVAGGSGELWVGRQRGGLTHLQRRGDGFTTVTYAKSNGLAQNSVYSVCLTRSGAVWAGTLSGGVSRLERETFTNYTIADGLASNTVASMLESADGAMWFATPKGLSNFSKGLWHTYSTAQGLPSDNINCLLEDKAGMLWAGTTAGLAFHTSSGFAIPAHAPAVVREQVLGLAEDAFGFLWLAAANHVLRVNRGKLLTGTLGDADIVEYGIADGLRGTDGVKRDPSLMRDSLGRIWISLNRGISVVDPARLTGRSAPAIPTIQAVAVDGVPINITSSVRIPSGRQRIVVSYAGLSLSIPERVRFRYRLEGFDRGWSEITAESGAARRPR